MCSRGDHPPYVRAEELTPAELAHLANLAEADPEPRTAVGRQFAGELNEWVTSELALPAYLEGDYAELVEVLTEAIRSWAYRRIREVEAAALEELRGVRLAE